MTLEAAPVLPEACWELAELLDAIRQARTRRAPASHTVRSPRDLERLWREGSDPHMLIQLAQETLEPERVGAAAARAMRAAVPAGGEPGRAAALVLLDAIEQYCAGVSTREALVRAYGAARALEQAGVPDGVLVLAEVGTDAFGREDDRDRLQPFDALADTCDWLLQNSSPTCMDAGDEVAIGATMADALRAALPCPPFERVLEALRRD